MQKPYMSLNELSELVEMSPKSILNATSRETFPIPTYKIGRQRVADRHVVFAYFKTLRDQGLEKLSSN